MNCHDQVIEDPPDMKSVPQAVQRMKESAASATGSRPYQLAQAKIDACKGDEACLLFWRKVWIQLMADEYVINPR